MGNETVSDVRSRLLGALLEVVGAHRLHDANRTEKLVALSGELAYRMGLEGEAAEQVELLARLRDLGKLALPGELLDKTGELTADERAELTEHPILAANIVAGVPELAHLAPLLEAQAERWDGLGYPSGIEGERIPLSCRIVFVCDAYLAMTSDRPYRPAVLHGVALAAIRANAGSQFCPRSAAALLEILDVPLVDEAAPEAPDERAPSAAPELEPEEPEPAADEPPRSASLRAEWESAGLLVPDEDTRPPLPEPVSEHGPRHLDRDTFDEEGDEDAAHRAADADTGTDGERYDDEPRFSTEPRAPGADGLLDRPAPARGTAAAAILASSTSVAAPPALPVRTSAPARRRWVSKRRRRLSKWRDLAAIGVGAAAGLLWALPLKDVQDQCPASGEGLNSCVLQKSIAPAFVEIAACMLVAFLLVRFLFDTLPTVPDRMARGEILPRGKAEGPDFSDDPTLVAANWGLTYSDAHPQRRVRKGREWGTGVDGEDPKP